MASADDLSPALRKDLLRYLFARARSVPRIIGELIGRNPGMADRSATWRPTTTYERGSRSSCFRTAPEQALES